MSCVMMPSTIKMFSFFMRKTIYFVRHHNTIHIFNIIFLISRYEQPIRATQHDPHNYSSILNHEYIFFFSAQWRNYEYETMPCQLITKWILVLSKKQQIFLKIIQVGF